MATLTHIRKHSIVHPAALIPRNCRLTNHCTLCSLTNTGCSVPLQNQSKALPPVCLQWTSELPSLRTTSPRTHQISLELEVPICQTSLPPMAQTRYLQAPLPRTSGSSPNHATSHRTQDSDFHCHASNSGSTGESQTRRGSLGHDPASSPQLVRILHLSKAAWVFHPTQKPCLSQHSHPGHRDRIMSSKSLVEIGRAHV